MKKVLLILISAVCSSIGLFSNENPTGKWIVPFGTQNLPNSWYAFKKTTFVERVPEKAVARIAVDSKYWMWINGNLVVFEGALKRGPNATDTYCDKIDIAPFLKNGENTIALLVWYFGKDGFSHISSGKTGLFFECIAPDVTIVSDKTWNAWPVEAYGTCDGKLPNFRLSESNIRYDARKEIKNWQDASFDASGMRTTEVFGSEGCYPWNKLQERPIPFFKDFGLKSYKSQYMRGDTLICELPYNCQFTPFLKVNAPEGELIKIFTDNYLLYDGGDPGLRAEYITKNGEQEYESLGWINGHKIYYVIPRNVKVLDVQFRETGYDTEFEGSFSCSDEFLNKLWEKSRRSLYITMRDNFMDCPDRERAQWAGDAVNESLEAYYSLSVSSHALVKKWLYETVAWQREDGSMFAPIPAGNWFQELPGQVLATIGKFGVWDYYMYTGDRQLLVDLYPGIKRYLDLWEPDGKGTMKMRQGDWTWGDWGDDRDMVLIFNLWYYIACQSMEKIASELGYESDALRYGEFLKTFKSSFNQQFWNGKAYRHPDYKDATDDRVQALAIVSGIADPEKYKAILKIFLTEEHASPYMEKYVFEAMMQAGFESEAIKRHTKRFSSMVNNSEFTTLFEGWGIGKDGFGGGTVNHGWSGGGLVICSQYICGISPTSPGFKTFKIMPQPGFLSFADAIVPSVIGKIKCRFENNSDNFLMKVEIPDESEAVIGVPFDKKYKEVTINGQTIMKNGKYIDNTWVKSIDVADKRLIFKLKKGVYTIVSTK